MTAILTCPFVIDCTFKSLHICDIGLKNELPRINVSFIANTEALNEYIISEPSNGILPKFCPGLIPKFSNYVINIEL